MTNKEKEFLNDVDEKVYHCLQRGIDNIQIAEWLDDVIINLPKESSSELFNILYRIQDNLLYGYELYEVLMFHVKQINYKGEI